MMKSDTAEIALFTAMLVAGITLLCTILGAWLLAVFEYGFIAFPVGGIAIVAVFTAVAFLAERRAE